MFNINGKLDSRALNGWTVVVTGAGGGIGYEAARSLCALGANVIIAEINQPNGQWAAKQLQTQFGEDRVIFVHTDVGDEQQVARLRTAAEQSFGQVDAVLNNATLAPLGAVQDLPIQDWDASYRVNLRAPALMATTFLPGMLRRRRGVFACVSSVGLAYMAAYESLKAAQVHLAASLDVELEGSGVYAFTIGPGFVPTQTALDAIPRLATLMGKPLAELQALVKNQIISIEAAGAGFALAIAFAERYHGQEISSIQVLGDAGIDWQTPAEHRLESADLPGSIDSGQIQATLETCRKVRATLAEQSAGWKERSIFERQWMARMFRSKAGMPVEEWLDRLAGLERSLAGFDCSALTSQKLPLGALARFYVELANSARGYFRDPSQRQEYMAIVNGWQADVESLKASLDQIIGEQA